VELLHPRCAGLDVHKASVVAGVRIAADGKVIEEVRSFSTTTKGLLELSEWLTSHEVTHVAMEATGVYWRPVWHILDGNFQLVLANAAHVRNVPGRKTDVKDAVWLADLLAHGLIRSSFVPEKPVEEMRQLTRTRKQLVREVATHSNRLQKVLEDTNIKLGNVVTDVLGVSGRAILKDIIEGKTDPEELANLARGRLKAKHAELVEALRGRVTEHHRFLLKLHLSTVDLLEKQISELDKRLDGALDPFRWAVDLLTSIPGIGETTASNIVSEIGTDMSRFKTAANLVSFAGLCPRNDESAGKKRSTRLRKASPWLKSALVQAAWAVSRKKNCYLAAQYYRLRARRGGRKAAVAVAASMLTIAYHLLSRGTYYEEKGGDYFTKRDETRAVKRHTKRLESLGYKVTLERQTAA
jgi:transposase